MSFFDDLIDFKFDPLAHYLDPRTNGLIGLVKGLLLPSTPKGPQAGEQALSADFQNDSAKIGDVQTVVYGCPRRWPQDCTERWFEYIGNDEVHHFTGRATVGYASIRDAFIGKTPGFSFPGFVCNVYAPGVRRTGFHPNVYTNPDCTSVEVVPSASRVSVNNDTFKFGPTGFPNRIDHDGGGLFDFVIIGSQLTVAGAGVGYDGVYVVSAYDPVNETVDLVGASFTTATLTATITWLDYDDTVANIKRIDNSAIVFDHTSSRIALTPDLTQDNHDVTVIVANDVVVFNKGGGSNRDTQFTVLNILGDGSWVVSPAPVTDAYSSDCLLVQRFAGPFVTCGPGDTTDSVAFDISFDQGLYSLDDGGGFVNSTVSFDPQWQQIDDAGNPLGAWTSFGVISVTGKNPDPQRRSFPFTLPTPCRARTRTSRVGDHNDGGNPINHMVWTGARGFVTQTPGSDDALDLDSTTIEVTVRVNGVLAAGSDNKFNCLTQRLLNIYDPDTQTWSEPQATNNPIWAALDALRGPYAAFGVAVPDSQIDLVKAVALAAQFDLAGIEFHGAFDSQGTLLDALQTILKPAKCAPTFDWVLGKFSFHVDAPADPVQMFTDRNSKVTSPKTTLQSANSYTGVIASYQDPIAWEEHTVGKGDTDSKPLKLDYRIGVIDRQRCWELAFYEWQKQLYRNRACTLDNLELEMLNVKFGEPVLIQSAIRRWGQSAEVAAVDGLALTLSNTLDWSGAGWFCYLADPNGVPTAKINCTRGTSDNILILASDPGIEITGDSTGEKRTPLAFGIPGNEPQIGLHQGDKPTQGNNNGHQGSIDILLDDPQVYIDAGDAPVDPNPTSVTIPALAIAGLALSFSGAVGSVSWTAAADAVLYELEWDYDGSIVWSSVGRPQPPTVTASFSVPKAGIVNVRARAYGDGGAVGDYSFKQATASTGTGGATALAVALSKSSITGTTTGPIGGTTAVTGAATGGTPGYTFAWSKVSGDAIVAVDPTSTTTAFAAISMDAGEVRTSVFRLTATDTVAAAAHADITVTISNAYNGGGSPS